MKKYLMILSSITIIGLGTVANIVSFQINQKNDVIDPNPIATDAINYDVKDGSTKVFQLPNALNLFKNLNKLHNEKNVKIKWTNIPGLDLTDNYGNTFLQSPFENMSVIYDLINTDSIEFKEIVLEINGTDRLIKLFLTYEIAGNEKTVQLDYAQQDSIPLKMENTRVRVWIPYQY